MIIITRKKASDPRQTCPLGLVIALSHSTGGFFVMIDVPPWLGNRT